MSVLPSDIVVYGSGTQHSSLLPSYKTRGVREAIERCHQAVGDPDLGAERLQVLSIEAQGEAIPAVGCKIVSCAES